MDHLVARRDVVQTLSPILADPDHVTTAAGADDAVGLDHPLDARQAFGQGPGLAGRTGLALLGVWVAGRDLVLDDGDLRLCLGYGSFQILQRQFQLRRVQLLGLRPELRAPVILNLAFQLLDQRLQLGDERVLLGHHRLFMLACRALDRELELNRRKGLHHLGRKVRKLTEIEGLRHAHFYPFRDRKPNKTTPKSTR